MRILFDQGTPAPLRLALPEHDVVTAFEQVWSTLKNGELLSAAEAEKFEKYQQRLRGRILGIIVLSTTSWPRIQAAQHLVVAAVRDIARSGFVEIDIP
jgi:hypothetical protein